MTYTPPNGLDKREVLRRVNGPRPQGDAVYGAGRHEGGNPLLGDRPKGGAVEHEVAPDTGVGHRRLNVAVRSASPQARTHR